MSGMQDKWLEWLEQAREQGRQEERERTRAILDGIHDALGESRDSDDESLPRVVAEILTYVKGLDAMAEAQLEIAQEAHEQWDAERALRIAAEARIAELERRLDVVVSGYPVDTL